MSVNVFDSSDVTGGDDDLGSPNEDCGGPGKGAGGANASAFSNCKPLGNLLIIQEPGVNSSIPDDSQFGGCMKINFQYPVIMLNLGILDFDPKVTVTVRRND